nr:hypothetical protein [Tanacetum cinerariifolium]
AGVERAVFGRILGARADGLHDGRHLGGAFGIDAGGQHAAIGGGLLGVVGQYDFEIGRRGRAHYLGQDEAGYLLQRAQVAGAQQ